ncbi:MAG: ABC transporter substrate-binding protein [Chloroflexota bacterium]|nr:ABC transporter substrate-binding protein [Chloroflexota bacterium]MDE2883734.1 ABC transporter substrate-binding protein [Chloroflexota bacterium]
MTARSVCIGLLVVLGMSIGMTLTACGEDEPVQIGSLMEFTGELSEFGTLMDQGVMLAATHVNEAGGVLGGRQIEVVSEDAGTTDITAVDAARKLVDVDSVSAIVGPLRSSHTQAVARAVTIDGEVPLMSPSATSPTITVLDDNNFVFRTAPSDAFQGVVLAKLAYNDLGYRSAGALYINDAYGQGLADQFEASFTALGGQVVTVPHEAEQPSYASELAQATANDPDVLIAISFPVSAGVYIREAIESGAADTFLFVDGSKSNDLIDAVGAEHLEGMYGTAPEALENEDRAQFDGDYMAAYNNDLSLPFIRESYDAAVIFALAAEAAGSSDPTAIRDSIRAVSAPPGEEVGPGVEEIQRALELLRDGREINYQGASGPVDVDENGDVTGAMGIWKIVNGELVTERIVTE